MQPYYHPTSITIIDDDPVFLESFSFYLSDDFRCETFAHPEEGLQHIQNQERMRCETHHFFREAYKTANISSLPNDSKIISWDPSQIYKALQSSKRFERISVAIVDYDMPGMNGLEVFRHIASCPIKKVLLTGKASIETAIKAFKEGIIDSFLMKQEINLSDKIHAEIKKLQKRYFQNVANLINPVKCSSELGFLNDQVFQETFEDLIHNRHIEEYYVSVAPLGILLIENNGNISFLHITTEKNISEKISYAEKLLAPSQLLNLLRTKKVLSIFPTEDGNYSKGQEKNWNQYLWPAQKLKGKSTNWYISLLDNEELPETLVGKIASYNDFLDAAY